jgi:hypothetical protein
MNSHPYIKTYMAGVVLPSMFLLVVLMVFIVARLIFAMPIPIERMIVFPMAVIPNLWGLWNVLYVAVLEKRGMPLGAWGALLPLLLIPGGLALQNLVDASLFTIVEGLIALPIVSAVYYLIWKHAVGFFNDVVGVGNLNS